MLSRSSIVGESFLLGEEELAQIIRRTIKTYQFHHKNECPEEVIIPFLKEVDGVMVIYAAANNPLSRTEK